MSRAMMFSAPMVLAVLEGRKTQTRRICKPKRANSLFAVDSDGPRWADSYIVDPGNREWLLEEAALRPDEDFWARENFRFDVAYDKKKPTEVPLEAAIWFEADGHHLGDGVPGKLRPSIHLPEVFSRIGLLCVDVRVERLVDLSEEDALAEGIWAENVIVGSNANGGRHTEETADRFFYPGCCDEGFETAVDAYVDLWETLNGRGSFDANPLVWVYSFEVRACSKPAAPSSDAAEDGSKRATGFVADVGTSSPGIRPP